MERLGGLDSAFLYLETPTNYLHVAWAAVLDTTADPAAGSPAAMAALMRSRLPQLPALRRRLADPRLGYAQPDWMDVDVDPEDHITLDRPGPLEAAAATVLARPLDRSRPLWELHIVPDPAGDRTGLIMKMHHALLDGPSGAELMVQLLDAEPQPASPPAAAGALPVDAARSEDEVVRRRQRRLRQAPVRAAEGLRRMVDVQAAVQRYDLENPDVRVPLPLSAPRTLFNRPITGRRAVRFTGLPLDALEPARRAAGATVNDAVLAIVGGALRRYLLRHRALPPLPLHAMVPVALPPDAKRRGGNNLSSFTTTLGTHLPDGHERLAEVARVTSIVKRRHDQAGLGELVGLSDLVPPRAAQRVARWVGRLGLPSWGPVAFNLVVSNVPGPDDPFYCNGAPVVAAYPMGPITDWSAINVTVVSYRRYLAFGLVACPDVVPDLDDLAADLAAEIDALQPSPTPARL